FGQHLIERIAVRPFLFRQPRVSAEGARGAEYADVGGIDVLVCRERYDVAVLRAVDGVCKVPERGDVASPEESERVVGREALTRRKAVRDAVERGIADTGPFEGWTLIRRRSCRCAGVHGDHQSERRRTARVALCPPNPLEFDNAAVTARRWGVLAVQLRSHSGSCCARLIVGGMIPCTIASVEKIVSTAPAAPSM